MLPARSALRSAEGPWHADAVVLGDGTGYLVKSNLGTLDNAHTYQLWALTGTSRISAGILGPKLRTTAFMVAGELWGLALTEERAGGVVTTTNPPVVVGKLASPLVAPNSPSDT